MTLGMNPAERESFRAAKMKKVQAEIGKGSGKPAEAAPQLPPTRLKQFGQTFNNFDVTVPDNEWNLALSDLRYFGNLAPQLARGAKLTLVSDSYTKFAQAVVIGVNLHGRQVDIHVLTQQELPVSRLSQTNPDSEYEIVDGGIEAGWKLIRKADGTVMRSGLKDFEAALIERRHQHSVDLGRG
jgi:hypothetical protein